MSAQVHIGRSVTPLRQYAALWAFALDIAALIGAGVSIHFDDLHIHAVSTECRDMLPLPIVAFVYSWSGVALAACALGVAVWRTVLQSHYTRQRRPVSGRWITPLLITVSALVLLFTVFVLYSTFEESIPIPDPCSG